MESETMQGTVPARVGWIRPGTTFPFIVSSNRKNVSLGSDRRGKRRSSRVMSHGLELVAGRGRTEINWKEWSNREHRGRTIRRG